jgi:hypothetical protein
MTDAISSNKRLFYGEKTWVNDGQFTCFVNNLMFQPYKSVPNLSCLFRFHGRFSLYSVLDTTKTSDSTQQFVPQGDTGTHLCLVHFSTGVYVSVHFFPNLPVPFW